MIDQSTSARFFLNPATRTAGFRAPSSSRAPLAFHRRLPGYAPTPLISAPEIARRLGLGEVLLKVESNRFGLPAFKILGASWAIYLALEERVGTFEPWKTVDDLAHRLASAAPISLVTATDGNHGRAVAHMAKLLNLKARIFVPAGTARARIEGIASEGAQVEIVDGTYDDAVARAAEEAGEHCMVISDTSWPGYETVPRWVMEGYSTIFAEVEDELARLGRRGPDIVAVQFGVGALAAAVVHYYRSADRDPAPALVSVEPLHAACALASMEAGEIVDVPGPHDSIMAGLNCGRVSLVVWPEVSRGLDAFIAIADERAREAMRMLAEIGVVAGETGAAGLGGMIELLAGPHQIAHRAELNLDQNARLLVLITEGATDPESYETIVPKALLPNE